MSRLANILDEIWDERQRQDEKWGVQGHPDGTGPAEQPMSYVEMSGADLSYAARMQTDRFARRGMLTYADIFLEEVFEAMAEEDQERLRGELVQVAAVAVAWIEKIDREREENGE